MDSDPTKEPHLQLKLDSRSSSPGLRPGRVTALCSWKTHFAVTVPLCTELYKRVLTLSKFNAVGNTAMDYHPPRERKNTGIA